MWHKPAPFLYLLMLVPALSPQLQVSHPDVQGGRQVITMRLIA